MTVALLFTTVSRSALLVLMRTSKRFQVPPALYWKAMVSPRALRLKGTFVLPLRILPRTSLFPWLTVISRMARRISSAEGVSATAGQTKAGSRAAAIIIIRGFMPPL